jgi:5-methylcytosine-specific restriction endonuclease McrA
MDLVGKVFGRLTVIREYPERDNGRVRWWCSCSCGMGVLVVGVHLTNGLTRSCGCLRNELARKRKLGRTKFGSIEEKLKTARAAYKKISEAPLKSKSSLLSRILPCDNPSVKNGFITVTCKTCGKRFAPSKRSVTKRIASTEGRGPGQNNFYCSQACKIACPSFNAKPNQQDPRLRSSISQRQKTRSCQTRSLKKLQCDKVGYTYCERCGDLMPELHHTITVGKDPVGAINPAGHILLCVRCHLEVHRSCK